MATLRFARWEMTNGAIDRAHGERPSVLQHAGRRAGACWRACWRLLPRQRRGNATRQGRQRAEAAVARQRLHACCAGACGGYGAWRSAPAPASGRPELGAGSAPLSGL